MRKKRIFKSKLQYLSIFALSTSAKAWWWFPSGFFYSTIPFEKASFDYLLLFRMKITFFSLHPKRLIAYKKNCYSHLLLFDLLFSNYNCYYCFYFYSSPYNSECARIMQIYSLWHLIIIYYHKKINHALTLLLSLSFSLYIIL